MTEREDRVIIQSAVTIPDVSFIDPIHKRGTNEVIDHRKTSDPQPPVHGPVPVCGSNGAGSPKEQGRIIAYRKSGLSFRDVDLRTSRNPTSVIRIWNQWVAEGHAEQHAGYPPHPVTNARENRHIVRSALQNHIACRLISQEMVMIAARTVSIREVRQRVQQRGVLTRRPLLRVPLTMQHRVTDGDSGAPNDKTGCRSGPT
ncbi:hypothetical protein TNCV_1085581 [Trichonephila clavipes]|nr:hypothetical protein TNCV_1085581 [Trichonephila clavipes]